MSEAKIQNLLGLLELDYEHFFCHPAIKAQYRTAESLPDLAFRLRDEANGMKFHNAIYQVQQWIFHHTDIEADNWATSFWGMYRAQPQHWIVAALIAKELE